MKRLFSLLLCLTLLLGLAGCGGKKDMAFTAVLPQNVDSLDPQTTARKSSRIVIGSIFEGLCRIDEDGETAPGVASRWDHNNDYTQFTFHLRRAQWSDGSPVTADDFLFGIVRALKPETKAPLAEELFLIKNARAFYNGQAEENDLGVRAKGDRTLVIELETGYADFPALTAGNCYMPCSRAYFEESAGHYGLSAGWVLTNGPFTFPHEYAWNTDYNEQSISLVRSETYRGDRKTAAASVTYLIDYDSAIDEDPLAALTAGTVDILPLTEAQAREAEEQDCPVLSLEDSVTGLLLNPQADALEYVGTRELFVRTLDRGDLLSRRPSAQEAPGIMAACVSWDGEDYYPEGDSCYASRNDEIAQAIPSLLELLKLEKLPSITVICRDDPESIDVANGFLVSWNNKLGTSFNMEPLPDSEFQSRVAQGDYEAALYTLQAGGVTPQDVFRAFTSAASPTLLQDGDYDSALGELSLTRASCRELEEQLADEFVFYPLFRDKTYYGLSPAVSKITVTPDRRIDFSQARKKK